LEQLSKKNMPRGSKWLFFMGGVFVFVYKKRDDLSRDFTRGETYQGISRAVKFEGLPALNRADSKRT
jgi:hypothetical protein